MPKLNIYRILETFPKGPAPGSPVFPKGSLVEGYQDGKYIVLPMFNDIRLLDSKLEFVAEDNLTVDEPTINNNLELGTPTGDNDLEAELKNILNIPPKPSKKKYPTVTVKKDMLKGIVPDLPFDIPKGTVIDVNTMPQITIEPLMRLLEALPLENEFLDVSYPDNTPPSSLSDAIKKGSKDSEQLHGGFFEPPPPLYIPFPEGFPVTKTHSYPAQLYSSFTVMGNEYPCIQNRSLFVNGLGQGAVPHHNALSDQTDTNMYVGGIMPLGRKFTATTLQVFTNLPSSNVSVNTFLSGIALTYKLASTEQILGVLPMYLAPQVFDRTIEAGMDFRFDVIWNKEAQQQFHDEFKDPWWMQYVPADKKTAPRYLTVHVVMKGIMEMPL